MRFWTLVWRSLALRCPLCGEGELFDGWFHMPETCQKCGKSFYPEEGFYLGSIYFNYGLTALVVAIAYPALRFTDTLSDRLLLPATLGFAILFPIFFFRYARALWLGFDQYYDPRQGEQSEPDERPDGDGQG